MGALRIQLDAAARPAHASPGARPATTAPGAAALLRLQRTAGNRAVGAMLKRRSNKLVDLRSAGESAAGSEAFSEGTAAQAFFPAAGSGAGGAAPEADAVSGAGPVASSAVDAVSGVGAIVPSPVDAVSGAGPVVCAHPGNRRRIVVQPVFFRSAPDDPSPTGSSFRRRIRTANRVWNKLGVEWIPRRPIFVDNAALKTSGANNAEATAVAATRAAFGIEVFVVDNPMAYAGGAETLPPDGSGARTDQIVITDGGTSNTLLAHELGHVLGLFHPPQAARRTIMEPTGSRDIANPTRNTMRNYRRIRWPPPVGEPICLTPDR